MVYTCSVHKCRGNYTGGPKVHLFSFPKDDVLRRKWIKAIHRSDFEPTANSKVCELHFSSDEIINDFVFFNGNENVSLPLKQARLSKNAVPSILPGCPQYLSSLISAYKGKRHKKKRLKEREKVFANYEIKTEPCYLLVSPNPIHQPVDPPRIQEFPEVKTTLENPEPVTTDSSSPTIVKNKMGKVVSKEQRQMIVNLYNSSDQRDSKNNIIKSIAKKTGIGISTIKITINKYEKFGDIPSICTKKRNRKCIIDKIDDFTKEAIKKKIQDFYLNQKIPTAKSILREVNQDKDLPNFKHSTFNTLLQALNFKFSNGYIAEQDISLEVGEREKVNNLNDNVQSCQESQKWKKMPQIAKQKELLESACDLLCNSFDAFGNNDPFVNMAKVWADKLREAKPVQRKLAEKAIKEIIFGAESGMLHRNSIQINI